MKKLFVVMLIALFILAFAACGGETASTTQGTATTPTAPVVTTPTAPVVTSTTAPVVTSTTPTTTLPATTPGTTTPATTAYISPVQKEIKEKIKTAWCNEVHRMKPIEYTQNADGTMSYTWSLIIKAESGLFLNIPDYGIQFTTGEGAVVYIKDKNKDEDFTKYPVKEGSWKTARWCDIWFEAEGFVPAADGEYEIYLFFTLPDVVDATPYPGEEVYVHAPEPECPLCIDPIIFDPSVDDSILDAYKCRLDSHSEKYDISHTETKPENFPTNTFNFSLKTEDNFFPSGTDSDGNRTESFAEIIPEGAFACVKGPNDPEFTRYECDYMLTERNCDMWFTLKDFTPVAGTRYEMLFCFISGKSATHPYALHFVYAHDWIAGAPVGE